VIVRYTQRKRDKRENQTRSNFRTCQLFTQGSNPPPLYVTRVWLWTPCQRDVSYGRPLTVFVLWHCWL